MNAHDLQLYKKNLENIEHSLKELHDMLVNEFYDQQTPTDDKNKIITLKVQIDRSISEVQITKKVAIMLTDV